MTRSRLEQVRAVMPPEGTDLIDVFGPGAALIDTGGLVRDDAVVKMVARSAERAEAGPEGFREVWADWLEAWQSYRMYYDDIIERDDKVIMLVRLCGVTKRDEVEVEHEAAAVFRFEGDQVVELEFNLDRDDVLSG